MADSALQAALHPASGPDVSDRRLEPDWDRIDRELSRKRKRREVKMTRRQLWLEYCEDAVAQGMEASSYSQFCHLLSRGSEGQVPKVAMRFEYEPGVWGMADFSGKVLRLRLPDGGEKEVEIFVACLCHSRLIYAEAPHGRTCSRMRRPVARFANPNDTGVWIRVRRPDPVCALQPSLFSCL